MKVGFLDYQLTNSHFKKFHSLLTGAVGEGQVTIVAANELVPTEQGREWAAANSVQYSESAEEVVAASDALLVLAPNNPEKHLEVAGPALSSGKPVFIDKLLASTPAHAQEMVALAQRAKTPIMSASALRFAVEFDDLDKRLKEGAVEDVFARGYGKFPIYGVHTITMALRYFGPEIKRVIDTGSDGVRMITLDSGKGRATVELRDAQNGREVMPWQVGVLSGGRYETATVKDADGFYENLMRKTLHFFRTGESAISVEEQLATVEAQYAAEKSFAEGGRWVETAG